MGEAARKLLETIWMDNASTHLMHFRVVFINSKNVVVTTRFILLFVFIVSYKVVHATGTSTLLFWL